MSKWLATTAWLQRRALLEDKIPLLTDQFFPDMDPEEARTYILQTAQADPTGSQAKYITWLLRMWQTESFQVMEDVTKFYAILTEFERIKHLPTDAAPINRDINSYSSFASLAEALEPYRDVLSKKDKEKAVETQRKSVNLADYGEILYNQGGYTMLRVSEAEDSVALCRDAVITGWCFKDEETARSYLEQGPLYILFKSGNHYVAGHEGSDQLMDKYDAAVPAGSEVAQEVYPIFQQVGAITFGSFEKNWQQEDLPTVETNLLENQDPDAIWRYIANTKKSIWPEAEQYLVHDAHFGMTPALRYALEYKGRWAALEKRILNIYASKEELSTTPRGYLWEYVHKFVGGLWPDLEAVLINQHHLPAIVSYAMEVMQAPWPEGEKAFFNKRDYTYTDASAAEEYARWVYKGNWPEMEQFMVDANRQGHNNWAYMLSWHKAIKEGKRWPGLEQRIKETGEIGQTLKYLEQTTNPADKDAVEVYLYASELG